MKPVRSSGGVGEPRTRHAIRCPKTGVPGGERSFELDEPAQKHYSLKEFQAVILPWSVYLYSVCFLSRELRLPCKEPRD